MWEKMDNRVKILLLVFLIGAVGCGLFLYVLLPQIEAYAQVKQELEVRQAELSKAETTVASLKEETSKLEKAKKDFEAASELFNTDMRYGSDVVALGLKAASQNIGIVSLEPVKIITKAHTLEMPLKITAQGEYRSILAFCNEMEGLGNLAEIRYLKCESLTVVSSTTSESASVGAGSSSRAAASPGSVKATMTVVIYSSKTPEGSLFLEEMSKWLIGRYDIFRPTGSAQPFKGMSGSTGVTVVSGSSGSQSVGEAVTSKSDTDAPTAGTGTSAIGTVSGSFYESESESEPDYVWPK